MLMFKRKKLELIHKAKIVSLYKDYLENPDGNIVEYDLIKHNFGGGAGALLVDDSGCTYLVKQYRNSIDGLSLEIPAGGYSFVGESGEECARREVEEEIGFVPEKMIHITNMVSSIGTYDEKTDIYIGLNPRISNVNYDDGEFIDIVKLNVNDAINMIYSGEIFDSKTIVALLAYKDLKNSGIIK